MNKIITAAVGSIVACLAVVLGAPAAQAQVPPEPATSPAAAIDAGFTLLAWQLVLAAIIAVAVGAALALVIEHLARRSRSVTLAAA